MSHKLELTDKSFIKSCPTCRNIASNLYVSAITLYTELTVDELSNKIGYSPSNLSYHLKMLEKKGVINKTNDREYVLTEKGRRAFDEIIIDKSVFNLLYLYKKNDKFKEIISSELTNLSNAINEI